MSVVQPFTLTIELAPLTTNKTTHQALPPPAFIDRLGGVAQHLFLATVAQKNQTLATHWHNSANLSVGQTRDAGHSPNTYVQRPYVIQWPELHQISPKSDRPTTLIIRGNVLGNEACEALLKIAPDKTLEVIPESPTLLELWPSQAIHRVSLTLEGTQPVPLANCLQSAFQHSFQEHRIINLTLNSPTAFKKCGSNHLHPFPELALMLQSALKRWNALMPDQAFPEAPEALLNPLCEACELQDMHLSMRRAVMGQITLRGAVGRLRIKLPRANQGHLLMIAHTLLASSHYTHVGTKTQMGFGHVSYTPALKPSQSKTNTFSSIQR